jgi:hypothetical protein
LRQAGSGSCRMLAIYITLAVGVDVGRGTISATDDTAFGLDSYSHRRVA